MVYSGGMTDELTVPDITPGYPSKGRQIGPAWRVLYTRLHLAGDEYLDGRTLAVEVADERAGLGGRGNMSVETLAHLLRRAADKGVLEREYRTTSGTRGMRRKAFYRVPRGE
jgi:hypothetical protein